MASWSDFAADEPRLADEIRSLMLQYGPGLGYLATVRADGGPRVHPVSPVITDEGLFCFVVDSPKRRDLERDGRYALHSFPPEDSDDEAYLAGRATVVKDRAKVARLAGHLRAAPQVDWKLFEFTVDVAMLARHGRNGATPFAVEPPARPAVQVWLDPAAAGSAAAPERPAAAGVEGGSSAAGGPLGVIEGSAAVGGPSAVTEGGSSAAVAGGSSAAAMGDPSAGAAGGSSAAVAGGPSARAAEGGRAPKGARAPETRPSRSACELPAPA